MEHSVLIVEDEAVLAKNICTYLERHGFSVAVAGSADRDLCRLAAGCCRGRSSYTTGRF